ncbi:MAG: glycosyltransferase family 4 protein [Hyphomicrobium sp.]
MVKLIFVNRYFYPDHSATSQMLSDLAFALAAGEDMRVSVVTSRQRYDAPGERLPARESIDFVTVRRVWTSRFGRHNLAGRAIDYATFYVASAWAIWRLAQRGDVIVAKTDPPLLSLVVAPVAWLRGAKLVNWLQDIFPEVAQALGYGKGPAARTGYRILQRLRNWSLRQAGVNVALGDRMAEKLRQCGIAEDRIAIMPNWASGSAVFPVARLANPLRQEWGLDGAFVIGYSGNLGRAHEPQTLLDAIAQLEAAPAGHLAISWLFIGGGALYQELARAVTQAKLKSVQFRPYQPRERLAQSLSAADVHVVSLRPELEGLIVPSKFYGVAASGRPTIFIGDKDGEIGRLVAKHQCGIQIDQDDSDGLARACLKLASDPNVCQNMGANARNIFMEEFDKPIAVARWNALLSRIAK